MFSTLKFKKDLERLLTCRATKAMCETCKRTNVGYHAFNVKPLGRPICESCDLHEAIKNGLYDDYEDEEEFNEICSECEIKMSNEKLTEEEYDEYPTRDAGYDKDGQWRCENCREEEDTPIKCLAGKKGGFPQEVGDCECGGDYEKCPCCLDEGKCSHCGLCDEYEDKAPWCYEDNKHAVCGCVQPCALPTPDGERSEDVCCVRCGEFVCKYEDEPKHKDKRDEAVCDQCWWGRKYEEKRGVKYEEENCIAPKCGHHHSRVRDYGSNYCWDCDMEYIFEPKEGELDDWELEYYSEDAVSQFVS